MSLSNSPSDLEALIESTVMLWRKIGSRTQSPSSTGLTFPQMLVLKHLDEENDCRMSILADQFHLSLSSATQLIDRLVKAGYVTREIDATDRRVVRLNMTDAGRAALDEIKKQRLAQMKDIFAQIPTKDMRELIRIQQSLLAKLDSSRKQEG
jgi:DNA-binding MarR family transcriptional regulator